jgi:hypothetical protein
MQQESWRGLAHPVRVVPSVVHTAQVLASLIGRGVPGALANDASVIAIEPAWADMKWIDAEEELLHLIPFVDFKTITSTL